jgi:hypothetical protein
VVSHIVKLDNYLALARIAAGICAVPVSVHKKWLRVGAEFMARGRFIGNELINDFVQQSR